jgi:hypothetical protein
MSPIDPQEAAHYERMVGDAPNSSREPQGDTEPRWRKRCRHAAWATAFRARIIYRIERRRRQSLVILSEIP